MASAPNELVGAEQRHKRMKNCVPNQPGDRYCATEKQDIIQLAAGSPCPVLPELNSFSFTTRVSSEKEGNSEGVSSSMSSKKRMQLNAECEDDEALIADSLKFPQICESANPTSNSDEHIVVVRGGDGLPRFGEVIPGACDALVDVSLQLVADVDNLTFKAPVSCVYNPLVYAQNLHIQYIQKHGGRRVEALLVGMNPGPFGMAQTGVPFGDSNFVREFHGLFGKVNSPEILHPKRPVHGLDCQRSEVSGRRLWGWARDRFGCASAFFNRFWVYNYCPLVFMEPSETALQISCILLIVQSLN
ncbi:hypothetical protein KP509_07G058400 [Ceratopteris richardii]|uniref:Uncharacterized protein n=1 Tax=Ceratopteris richardii TaxID=49495 RepID=A0A8T2UEW2_CERRI|nr:hypothetical protein KP509_07G058400 [Ceratopteris richardii]